MSSQPADWLVEMTSRSWLSENARLPTKEMLSTLVTSPSLIDVDDIDAALAAVDGLGLDGGGKPAEAPVVLAHAPGVGMGLGRGIARPRLQVDERLELGLVDGAMALEGHGRDHGVLDHAHDDGGAAPLDPDVGEDAGGKQRLDRLVDLGRIVGAALAELQVGADGLRLDGAVARDLDGGNGLGGDSRMPSRPAKEQGKDQIRPSQPALTHPPTQALGARAGPGKAWRSPQSLLRRGIPLPKLLS